MTNADESKVTRPTAEAGAETLSARIRREGDLSSRAGQLDRLYALADEADTLRAQLEAAERLAVAVEVQAEENFQKYVDANEARIDAEARAEAAEAEAVRMRPALALCLKELRAMRVACGAGVMTDVAIFSAEAALAARTKEAAP